MVVQKLYVRRGNLHGSRQPPYARRMFQSRNSEPLSDDALPVDLKHHTVEYVCAADQS
jgi:hypothetical protein